MLIFIYLKVWSFYLCSDHTPYNEAEISIKILFYFSRSFKHICRQPGLVETLKTLTTEGICDKLTLAFLERLVVMAVKQDSEMSMSESSDTEAISSPPPYLDLLHDFLSSVPLSQQVADSLTK